MSGSYVASTRACDTKGISVRLIAFKVNVPLTHPVLPYQLSNFDLLFPRQFALSENEPYVQVHAVIAIVTLCSALAGIRDLDENKPAVSFSREHIVSLFSPLLQWPTDCRTTP